MSDELETAEKGMGADPALPDAVAAPSAPRPALDADQLAGQMHQNIVYLQRQSRLLRNRQHHIEQARVKLAREKETIHEQMLEVARQQTAVAAERDEIAALHTRLDEREQDIQQTRAAVEAIRASVQQRADDLGRKQEQLDSREAHLTALQQRLEARTAELDEQQQHLQSDRATLESALADAAALRRQVEADRTELAEQRRDLERRLELAEEREQALSRRAAEIADAAEAQAGIAARIDEQRGEMERQRAALVDEDARLKQRHADLTRRAAAIVAAEEQQAERLKQAHKQVAAMEKATRVIAASLVLACDDGVNREVPLPQPICLIGRDPMCDLRIQLNNISRAHCMIYRDGGRLLIRDVGSTNGTFVNDKPIDRLELRGGETLAIGELVVTVRIDGKPKRVPSPRFAAAVLKKITLRTPPA